MSRWACSARRCGSRRSCSGIRCARTSAASTRASSGRNGDWLALTLRAIGYVSVTPFVEELFMRSWLMRYVDVANSRRSFRSVPIAHFSWPSFLIVTIFFVTTHQLWEYGVMLGWTLLTMGWFYHRKHIAPIILVHAVTNGAIFAFVVAFDRVFRDASGEPISLWFFL